MLATEEEEAKFDDKVGTKIMRMMPDLCVVDYCSSQMQPNRWIVK